MVSIKPVIRAASEPANPVLLAWSYLDVLIALRRAEMENHSSPLLADNQSSALRRLAEAVEGANVGTAAWSDVVAAVAQAEQDCAESGGIDDDNIALIQKTIKRLSTPRFADHPR